MDEFDQLFRALKITENELRDEILKSGILYSVPKNSMVIEQGENIKWLMLLISGKLRVWQENEDRQILLYYLTPIQTCALSLSSAFRYCKSQVNAKTEEDSIFIKIPVRLVNGWSFKFKSWSIFITNTFIFSYDDLLLSYRSLAFKQTDERLLEYLNLKSGNNNSEKIFMTHSQLASEIGSTREVVSRILKQFEKSGLVKLKFKQIELL